MIYNYKSPLRELFDTILEDTTIGSINKFDSPLSKTYDVSISEDDYKIKLVVPGLTKEDLKITQKEDEIHVIYETEDKEKIKNNFIRPFKKIYTIPKDVDDKKIEAKIENGIMEIIFPKNKKKLLERLITLN